MACESNLLQNEAVQSLAKNQNKFARNLYLELSKEMDGNIFFSPFSISSALAMAHTGSEGNTESQMRKVMHLSDDKAAIKTAFQDLLKDLKKKSTEYELRSSNLMYISDKLAVHDSFASTLTDFFLSSTKLVDFDNSEPVRQDINVTVEKETNSKIKDLIPRGILTADTRMVLLNAIYFKGLWNTSFDKEATKPLPFWSAAETSSNVDMMVLKGKKFRTGSLPDLDARLLAMDYKGERLSMIVVLPNQRDGLTDLEKKLSSASIETLDSGMRRLEIPEVILPKFKLEETLKLIPVLESMGITDLFSEAVADLSGISEDPLFVSSVIHKAFLEVNEEGSEAAAATAVVMQLRCALMPRPPPPPFVADHPFFFYIKDNHSQQVLFMGRLQNPNPA